MEWSSTVSEEFSLRDAVDEAVGRIQDDLGPEPPDLAVAFISAHHAPEYGDVPALVSKALRPRVLIGCSAGGVIGGGREVEDRIGFSLTAARLPDVELVPFHVENEALPDLDAGPGAWEQLIGVEASQEPHLVVLVDPFSLQAENLLTGLDYAYPGSVKVGGLASGGSQPGSNALILGDRSLSKGAVGVAMHGNIRVDTVVAQGCRPVGKPAVVTKSRENLLLELDGRKPMEVLREIFEASEDRDRKLLSSALHLGVVMDPLKSDYRPGDFLIRNVMGIHQETEGLFIGEVLREGQVVQFHVRDAQTAADDLETLLSQYVADHEGAVGSGALLFSCLGRGKHLFGAADHDTGIFQSRVGDIPLGGFFCNGEIGPVGETTFLHGFTSSFGIFSPKSA
ncbi:MAG: FIST C-terminal domain-containing protein [Chloroflexi bacterium]|nr:FIST C-terminal domain-containing protein [Chloroflexota bacterium]